MIVFKNKIKSVTTLLLILTIVATSVACLSVVNAAELDLYAFISVNPNPIGVGQSVTINVFTQPLPPSANDRFENLVVDIWYPGAASPSETLGPVRSWSLGNYFWTFIPSVVGTYYFQFRLPMQTIRDYVYTSAVSPKVALTVQQDPIQPLPDTPLPTEYWTFPIDATNRLWGATSGSWLMSNYDSWTSNAYNPYTTGPKTSHILWEMPISLGGIEGGTFDAVAYAQGRSYEGKFTPRIILNKYLYQYGPVGDRIIPGTTPLNCIDLATGEIVWSRTDIRPSFGHIYRYDSANQVGLHAYLWSTSGSTWNMYDAMTGNFIMSFENASTGGTTVFEPETGNILNYIVNMREGWMAMWNFTKACVGTRTNDGVITWQSAEQMSQFGVAGGQWRPRTSALNDWMRGIEWNVSITEVPQGQTRFYRVSGPDGVGVTRVKTILGIGQMYGVNLSPPYNIWGPVDIETSTDTDWGIDATSGVVLKQKQQTMQWLAYDLYTGDFLWASDPGTHPWGAYMSLTPVIAYDRLYSPAYDGLHCYDITNGKELWHFTAGNSGLETPYGTWVGRSAVVADGKVYFETGEWHPQTVMQRGDRLYCVDALTGENIWNITGFWETPIIANGHLVDINMYDNTMYVFNKGPSATTVSASPKVVTSGSAVLIEGTVTDQSPAAKQMVESGRFSMVPAIADTDMTEWMEYVYMQQPKPTDAIGVPVYLQAIGSDGSVIDLGYVYSSINGNYHYLWTPPTQDTYKILATFKGTDAYWPSSSETALGVTAALTPATPIEPEQPAPEAPFISTEVAIVAVVAVAVIIGAVAYWALRKRK